MTKAEAVTIPTLQQMKRDGRKIVGVVLWDFQMARIVEHIGVEIVSVGDSVGVNLWGREREQDIDIEEMIIVCKAVRRGVTRALLSCDVPSGALQTGRAVDAAVRIVEETGADMIKLDGAADHPAVVRDITRAGIGVFAQMEFRIDADHVGDAQRLEAAGASLIDFKHSGPHAGAAVASAVSIPVLGGLGGGPWLDGRLRMAHAAIGYAASNIDTPADTYANVARVALDALSAYAEDVRAGRQIKGTKP